MLFIFRFLQINTVQAKLYIELAEETLLKKDCIKNNHNLSNKASGDLLINSDIAAEANI